jgi:rhamnogalacturonan endolyase
VFDSDSTVGGRAYRGQGNHNLAVADVDGDGRDEVLYGACTIDDDGKGLYSTGLGHGDAIHVGDLDPARPGFEALAIHERPRHPNGLEFRDARTGEVLWGKHSLDVGRGLAADIDPRHDGEECWAAGEGLDVLYSCRGEPIGPRPRSCNFAIWWGEGPRRELLDGTRIIRWDHQAGRETVLLDVARFGCRSNNGTKATPCLVADIIGDAREEAVYRSEDGRELRVFIAPGPAPRRVTRWHDPIYRLSVAWQNVGYNLPTRMSVPESP